MIHNCSNCRHYYGKIHNFHYTCCAMYPHGPDSVECVDWQEKTKQQRASNDAVDVRQVDIRQAAQVMVDAASTIDWGSDEIEGRTSHARRMMYMANIFNCVSIVVNCLSAINFFWFKHCG